MNPDDVRILLVLLLLSFPSLLALSSVSFSGLCPSPIFLPFWFRGSKAFHQILFPLIYILKKKNFSEASKITPSFFILNISYPTNPLRMSYRHKFTTSRTSAEEERTARFIKVGRSPDFSVTILLSIHYLYSLHVSAVKICA